MGDYPGDLLGEAERNRRIKARGICHRSPSAGVEAMVAVVDGRFTYRTFNFILFLPYGPPGTFLMVGGRKIRFPRVRIYDTISLLRFDCLRYPILEFLCREKGAFLFQLGWKGAVTQIVTSLTIRGINLPLNNKGFNTHL